MPAGEIARRLDVAQNTMSAHLKTLATAGLVAGNRSGKVIAYKVDPELLSRLGTFLSSLVIRNKDPALALPDENVPAARKTHCLATLGCLL